MTDKQKSPAPSHYIWLMNGKIYLKMSKQGYCLFLDDICVAWYPIDHISICDGFFPFTGYKVITFKNPYLGNTCVPFQHWACSHECARAVEIPARKEQILAARHLDQQYEDYIAECETRFSTCRSPRSFLAFGSRDNHFDMHDRHCTIKSKKSVHLDMNSITQNVDDSFEDDVADINKQWRRRRRLKERKKHPAPLDSSQARCGCVISWWQDVADCVVLYFTNMIDRSDLQIDTNHWFLDCY